MAGKKNKKWWY